MTLPITAPFLTVIPDRNPKNKPHMTIGEAKKAVLFRLRGDELDVRCMVYKWEPTGWERLWNIPAGTQRDDLPWHAR